MSSIWKDRDVLEKIASESNSMSEMLSALNLNKNSGNYQTLKKYCKLYNIEIPIFSRKDCTKEAIRRNTTPLEELFSNRGIKVQGQVLRYRLVRFKGVKDECVRCGQLPIWLGKELVLEVDHIDGDIFNNNIENLRILCLHCHSQTDNFRGRNSGKKIYNYCPCGTKISKGSVRCRECNGSYKKSEYLKNCRYPSLDILYLEYLKDGSFEKLAVRYSVNSNSIRKYIKGQGLSLKDFRNKNF